MVVRPSASAIAIVAVMLLVLAGNVPLHAQTLQVSHELGTTTVSVNPQRVIVFDFGMLDSLDKLGIDVLGLAKTNIPAYLSKFEDSRYASIGSLQEPDYEAINALKPDLIIISGRQSAHYEQLSDLAPTIFMGVDQGNYLASMENNWRNLGRIFGVETAVENEIAELQQSIERVQALATGKNALILLVTGGRASAFGPGSRFGLVHDVLGVAPVDPTVVSATHGQSISWEYVLVQDPDLLLVVDRDAVVAGGGAQTAKQIVENELVQFTKAYTTGNITYLNPGHWYLSGGGLTSFALMVNDIEQALLNANR